MLLIVIRNDGTGDERVGHYQCSVSVTDRSGELMPLAAGRVENHLRELGWRELVGRVAEELPPARAVRTVKRDA